MTSAGRRTKTLRELLNTDYPEQEYIIGPELLSAGGTMAIYGEAGTLKSWLAIDMVFSANEGKPWLGMFNTRKVPTLTVQCEQTEQMYAKRLSRFTIGRNGVDPEHIYFDNDLGILVNTFPGFNALKQDIEENTPRPKLVVMDCLYKMIEGTVSDEVAIKRYTHNLDLLRSLYGCAFCTIHHPRKAGDTDKGADELLGHSSFRNWLDTVIKVEGVPPGVDNPLTVKLTFQKVRNAEKDYPPVVVRFSRERMRFTLA